MIVLIVLASVVCVAVWSLVLWFTGIENSRLGRRLKAWYFGRLRR